MTKNKNRFTLQTQRWYACEIIGDEFEEDKCSYSPIRIDRVEPLKRGKGVFRLSFYHGNYPEGVRSKAYTLQTIKRERSFMLVLSVDHKPTRFLQIYAIDWPWVSRHFPGVAVEMADVQEWLGRHF